MPSKVYKEYIEFRSKEDTDSINKQSNGHILSIINIICIALIVISLFAMLTISPFALVFGLPAAAVAYFASRFIQKNHR